MNGKRTAWLALALAALPSAGGAGSHEMGRAAHLTFRLSASEHDGRQM